MRGVISAGMVDALAAAGIRPLFDLAIGVSAGACNVAALMSDTTALPSRLERDRDVMVRAGKAGRAAAQSALGQVFGPGNGENEE